MSEDQRRGRGRPRKDEEVGETQEQKQVVRRRKAQPQILYKGNRTFRHDLFKLMPEKMLKNTSFRYGVVNLSQIEHCHFFHTFNSHGKKQEKSNSVGGHYHEVTWEVDEETGKLIAKCGPAMRKVQKKRGGKMRTFHERVKWFDENADNGRGAEVFDEHIHECEYQYSEELNQDNVRNLNKETSQAILQSSPRPQAMDTEGLSVEEG